MRQHASYALILFIVGSLFGAGLATWVYPPCDGDYRMEAVVRGLSEEIRRAVPRTRDVRTVTVTAYTASRDECDQDPGRTAIMAKPVPGWTAAVSRDLLGEGWVFGDRVWIEGVGVFEIADVMNAKWTQRIDVLVGTKDQARKFGVLADVMAVRIRGRG